MEAAGGGTGIPVPTGLATASVVAVSSPESCTEGTLTGSGLTTVLMRGLTGAEVRELTGDEVMAAAGS